MRYSIYSRFRGALLGIATGEMLALSKGKKSFSDAELSSDRSLLNLVALGIKSLIVQGRFSPEAWQDLKAENLGASPTASLLATLPLALFYHENELKLRQNLQLALVAMGRDEPESRDGTLALGCAIATAVQAKSTPTELIARSIAFCGASSTATTAKLVRVKTLLNERAGLARAIAELGEPHQPSSQVALAFFCCLSTPADTRLTLQRAAISDRSGSTSAIAGALSGAYNGMASIPTTLALAAGVTNQAEVLRLCDALVAVWSGVYEQGDRATASNQITAIAAPQIVRRR